jgi:aminoglycoside 2''-phosphotransferase
MKKYLKIANQIAKEFPEFTIHKIQKIGAGMDSVAYLINGDYIFRFPKRENVKTNLRKEINFLPHIKPLTNILVPDFEFIASNLSFVGYKKIEGAFLTNTLYQSLNTTQQTIIQKEMAHFITLIHAFDLSALALFGIEKMDFKDIYFDHFKDIKEYVYPHISDIEKEMIKRIFTNYLDDANNFNYTPTLLHNDLSYDHIIVDADKGNLVGIIDFGDMAIGDPDYDLMCMANDYGGVFLDQLLAFYPHSDTKRLKNKIYFFQLAHILYDFVAAAKGHQPDAIKDASANLKNWMR